MSRPELLQEIVPTLKDDQTIIIDEIQKVPKLLSLIHLLIEEKRGNRFILTGSSSRKLKQKGVDLLGGRAVKRTLHPFMAAEILDRFNLKFPSLPSEQKGKPKNIQNSTILTLGFTVP